MPRPPPLASCSARTRACKHVCTYLPSSPPHAPRQPLTFNARTHARTRPPTHAHAHTHTESEGSFSTLRNLLRCARTSCIFSPDPTPPTLAPLFTGTPLPGPWPLSAVENSKKSGPWSLVIMCYYVQVLGTDLCAGTGRRLVIVACCCSPICCCCCRRCNTAR